MTRAAGALIRHRSPFRIAHTRIPQTGDVDSLFAELWNAPLFRTGPAVTAPNAAFVPHIDAVDAESEYRVSAELPGLSEKDYEILLEDGVLTIKGEKREHTEVAEGERRCRVETSYGAFERRLRFDSAIDEDKVTARYENGVLTIVLPKPEEARPQVRSIPVQSN